METGTPYLLFKDSINKKSNQKNLGTIKSSNLCTEITEYSNRDETAVCNLASIGLPKFVKEPEHNFTEEVTIEIKEDCLLCKMGVNLLKKINLKYIIKYSTEDDYQILLRK